MNLLRRLVMSAPISRALTVPPTGQTWKSYYYAGSQLIAQRVSTASSDTLYYLLGDHLGSTAITANSGGGFSAELRYKPWGETRYSSGTTPTRRQFTGQITDTEIGLYFYDARYYSPAIGRFVSVDTVVSDQNNLQHLNRFSYVGNRPLNFTDPSGHCPKDDKVCEEIVRRIKETYGVTLQDDTAAWQWQEARLVEGVLYDIAKAFMNVNNISWDAATTLVKITWNDVVMNRMHSTTNPFGGHIAWTVPMFNGKLIEIPDAGASGLWNWNSDIQWTKWVIAHELGHSWDFRGTNFSKYLGGYNGGRLSEGLVKAVGADATSGCLGLLFCISYDPGREDPVGGRTWDGAKSPAEDWGSSFAQFVEPRRGMQLGPMRAQYVANQMALVISQP